MIHKLALLEDSEVKFETAEVKPDSTVMIDTVADPNPQMPLVDQRIRTYALPGM